MTGAAAALATAEAAGARFRLVEGGRVRFTLGEAPAEVVAELRRHRGEVAAILAERERTSAGGHDAAERAAMAAHQAVPADAEAWCPGTPDPLRAGLLVGASARPPSWADAGSPPPPGAWCSRRSRHRRSGSRWWRDASEPRSWRCRTCYPPEGPWTVMDLRT